MQLDHDRCVTPQALLAGLQQAAVRLQAVARGEDCRSRLVSQVGIVIGVGGRQVGQVGDDEVNPIRHRLEQIAVADMDSSPESMSADVGTCKCHSATARIRSPDLCPGFCSGERNRNRPGACADIDNARRMARESLERGRNELLRRPARCHHTTGRGAQGNSMEPDVTHARFVLPAAGLLREPRKNPQRGSTN
jgi:hypothetical protein